MLTLDQQLWWIVYIIIEDQPLESELCQLQLMHKMYSKHIIIIILAYYVILLSVSKSYGYDVHSSESSVMSLLTAGSTSQNDTLSDNVISELQVMIRNCRTSMMEHRTGKIWLLHFSMVKILHNVISASGIWNWNFYIKFSTSL